MSYFYLERMINDHGIEVMPFSNSIVIELSYQRQLKYHIRKEESSFRSIKGITAAGVPYPYQRANNEIDIDILIQKGKSRHIAIGYENELCIISIDISKRGARVYRPRGLSD
jgi:hypothetical protein